MPQQSGDSTAYGLVSTCYHDLIRILRRLYDYPVSRATNGLMSPNPTLPSPLMSPFIMSQLGRPPGKRRIAQREHKGLMSPKSTLPSQFRSPGKVGDGVTPQSSTSSIFQPQNVYDQSVDPIVQRR